MHRVAILAGLVVIGLLFFLTVARSYPWVLLFIVVLAFLGTDGILRSHPSAQFRSLADTSPYLFVPVLLPLAAGLFFERFVGGYWGIPASLVTGLLFAAVVYAEYHSVDPGEPNYVIARFVINVGAYLAAFALYTVILTYMLAQPVAIAAVALSSLLLSVEILREGEEEPVRVIGMAAVIGVILGEARWVLHYLPLGTFVGAVALLLAFYLVTGLLQSYLVGQLDMGTVLEFAIVAAVGSLIIVVAQIAAGS